MTPAVLFTLVAAPAIGSFLGTLVLRLPEGRSVVTGRSACDDCGHQLTARELVPLASWLVQRGRCRACGATLSPFYPAIELAALAVALSSAFSVRPFFVSCLLGWALLVAISLAARWLLPKRPAVATAIALVGVIAWLEWLTLPHIRFLDGLS